MDLMLPSWRLARNTLAGKPGRTALMIGAVALAASLVVAVSCAFATAQATMEQAIAKILGAADARIIHPGNGRFDESLLEQARAWPEVEHAAGRLFASLTLVHADQRRDPKTGQMLRATPSANGVDFNDELPIRSLTLIAGRMPTAPDEILIDEPTAELLQATAGDELNVQRFGDPITLRVVGMYKRPRLTAVQRPLIQVDRSVLGEATGRTGQLTSIVLVLKPNTDVEAFCATYQDALPSTVSLEPAEKVRSGFDRQIEASRFGLVVASVLTFMSASFIIVTALTTSVTERQRELAVTRCIGASRGQLFVSQLVAGLAIAAVGALIGIPLGIGLTGILVWYFRDLLEAGLHLHGMGIGLAMIGAASAGMLGGLYPAWMASHVSPLQAMAYRAQPLRWSALVWCGVLGLTLIALQLGLLLLPDASDRFYAYAYAGLPTLHIGYFILAVPMVVAVAMALGPLITRVLRLPQGVVQRSVIATPFRHGFTAGALMVGVAILVSTWSNMTSLLDDWVSRIKFADGFAHRITGITPQQQRAIASLPFVEATCPIGYLPLRVEDRQIFGVRGLAPPNVTCFGFDPEVFFRINTVEWTAGDPATAIASLNDGSGIIVADRFLTTQRAAIGDTITLSAGGRSKKTYTIVGAVNSAGLDVITQTFGIRNQYMELSISAVFMHIDEVARTFDNRDVLAMQINLRNDYDIADEAVAARIADVAPGVAYNSGRWIMQTINDVASTLLAVQSTIAFAALVLASIGTGNVILANIHGRRHEYGVLRAVGASKGVLARLIFGEAAVLAMTGAIIGSALGLHMAWVGASHYRDLAGLPVRLTIPELPMAAGWLVLLALTLLAAVPGVLSVVRRHPSVLLASGRHG